jgi:hypothetical protein
LEHFVESGRTFLSGGGGIALMNGEAIKMGEVGTAPLNVTASQLEIYCAKTQHLRCLRVHLYIFLVCTWAWVLL